METPIILGLLEQCTFLQTSKVAAGLAGSSRLGAVTKLTSIIEAPEGADAVAARVVEIWNRATFAQRLNPEILDARLTAKISDSRIIFNLAVKNCHILNIEWVKSALGGGRKTLPPLRDRSRTASSASSTSIEAVRPLASHSTLGR